MKLYSRTQLFRTVLICVVAAVLLTAAVCVNIYKKNFAVAAGGETEVAGADISEISSEGVAASVETANPVDVIPVAGGTSG